MTAPALLLDLFPPPGSPLILAVSGGVDSCTLLDVCVQLGNWPLVVYHLNHQLRAQAAIEATFVRERVDWYQQQPTAPELKGVFEVHDIAQQAEDWSCGVEEAGRRYRYQRLAEIAAEYEAQFVVTGHHRDDQAETVIANILRGAGLNGMAGIAPTRSLDGSLQLLRPMLHWPKRACYEYLRSRSLDWCEDASNFDTKYYRNEVRHTILPSFEQGAPGFTDALLERVAQNRAQLDEDLLQIRALWGTAQHDDCLELFIFDDPYLQQGGQEKRLLLWRELSGHLALPINRGNIHRLDDLYTGPSGKQLELGEWLFHRRRDTLQWELAHPDILRDRCELTLPGETQRGEQHIRARIIPRPVDLQARPDEAFMDREQLWGGLQWGPVAEGLRWQPFGADGSKSVLRYLADRGVPQRQRRGTAIVEDDHGPVWIPGFTIADRVRVTGRTEEVVHLRLERAP